MRLSFFRGAALGAVTSVLTLGATAALAGTGPGANFNLGKVNSVNATSTLTGSATGSLLKVPNTNTGAGAQAISAFSAGATAATIRAQNTGGGPAAEFDVTPGQAPFTVNSATEVANLNAATLQGKSPADFYAAGSTVADSSQLGGQPPSFYLPATGTAANSSELGGVAASGYQQRCTHGSLLAFAQVPASGSFSATYTTLAGGFTCGVENFAKRVTQGDYRVLFCGTNGAFNPVALATDTSFNDFTGVQLVSPDSDAVTTCGNVGTSVLSEFKITTRNAQGVGQDQPFTVAQLGS